MVLKKMHAIWFVIIAGTLISFSCCLQAVLKKSNLELEADLKVKLNNIEMLNEAVQMKERIIKVLRETMHSIFNLTFLQLSQTLYKISKDS